MAQEEEMRLKVLAEVLEMILSQPTRKRQIAALGVFTSSLTSGKILPQDLAILKIGQA